METNLGMDLIQETPVQGMIARWKRIVERRERGVGPFSMLYLAVPDQKQEIAINYLAQQLDIGEDDRVTVNEPKRRDLTVALEEIADKVRSLKGKRVLIIARGFEERFLEKDDPAFPMFYRLGHDWDQEITGDGNNGRLGKLYNDMKKHLIIITTIGFSCGQEAYENAVKSAASSQFTGRIIELGK